MGLSIAALASGRGSNIAAIAKAIDDNKLDARIALILTNNPEAGVLAFAQERGIPVWVKSHKGIAREEYDSLLVEAITQAGADTIVLAGYMRLVTSSFVSAFAGRIVNIHPAILPSFAGAHGGADAVAYGVRLSGVTVHFVDEIMDNGPVIIQGAVPALPHEPVDALMQRIHCLEHRLFPQALQWLAEDRLRIEGRSVRLLPAASSSSFGSKSGVEHALQANVASQVAFTGQCGCGSYGVATTGAGESFAWLVSPALEGF